MSRTETISPIMQECGCQIKKVAVLGSEYSIETRYRDDDRKLHDSLGYMEPYTKEIILREITPDCETIRRVEELRKEILRHEIVHAFFWESGTTEWCDNEQLVEWVAMQLPKMVAAMQEVGAMPDADG